MDGNSRKSEENPKIEHTTFIWNNKHVWTKCLDSKCFVNGVRHREQGKKYTNSPDKVNFRVCGRGDGSKEDRVCVFTFRHRH